MSNSVEKKKSPWWEAIKAFAWNFLGNVALFGGLNVALTKIGNEGMSWRQALDHHVHSNAWGLRADALFGLVFGLFDGFMTYGKVKEERDAIDKKSNEEDAQITEIRRLLRPHTGLAVSGVSHQGQLADPTQHQQQT